MMSIEDRLAVLETSARRWRHTTVMLILIGISLIGVGADKRDAHPFTNRLDLESDVKTIDMESVIRCRGIIVTDKNDKAVAYLGTTRGDGGGGQLMLGADLAAQPMGVSLLSSTNGNALFMGTNDRQSAIFLGRPGKSKFGYVVGVTDQSAVEMIAVLGRPVQITLADDTTTSIGVYDAEGKGKQVSSKGVSEEDIGPSLGAISKVFQEMGKRMQE